MFLIQRKITKKKIVSFIYQLYNFNQQKNFYNNINLLSDIKSKYTCNFKNISSEKNAFQDFIFLTIINRIFVLFISAIII